MIFRLFFGNKNGNLTTLNEHEQCFDFEIVGESFYQDNLSKIVGGKTFDGHDEQVEAVLYPERNNPYDKNAVAVKIQNRQVGHLSKADASIYRKHFKTKKKYVEAIIVGGWDRKNGDEGHFGVKLDFSL